MDLDTWEDSTLTENSGELILPDIAASIKENNEKQGIEMGDIEGVGMGVPGPIKDDGTVLKCVNLGWGVFNVAQSLSVPCGGIKVKAGNDANVVRRPHAAWILRPRARSPGCWRRRCGLANAAWRSCKLRQGAEADFEGGRRWSSRQGRCGHRRGLPGFGPARPRRAASPAARTGRGSYALLMEPGWTIVDHVAGETAHEMIGVHGGLSADEMLVPLILKRT